VSREAGYGLYHPTAWKEEGGATGPDSLIREDQVFVLGELPDGIVSLNVDTASPEAFTSDTWPDCAHFNVAEGKYHALGPFLIGGVRGFRYSSATPKGYQGEPFFGAVVTVMANGTCFRFEAFSPTPKEWNANSGTVFKVFGTVTFRRAQ